MPQGGLERVSVFRRGASGFYTAADITTEPFMPEAPPEFTEAGSALRPFPAASDVFAAEQVFLARHLHPLVSVDLGAVNSAWSGWLHLLSPLEPADGLVGMHTEAFHSELLRTNWIGFKVIDGRYRLMGDPRYFLLENNADDFPDPYKGARQELEQHYAEQERSYNASREYFLRTGKLVHLDKKGKPLYGNEEAAPLVDAMSGTAEYGSWVDTVEFPVEHHVDESRDIREVWPLSPTGRRFHHIASVAGWNYRTIGADTILLFYEPVEGLALLTFDWT